ncbi:double strand RNA binding domain from DEAD END PROTEIN 1 [Sesbania bispinosa]|nr:double strand RNA binding domain from DEAD END PROTEIN 1 [Sesbania bispinosa]
MAPSDVCPTEDAIQVFLEHLVDPLLPAKASVRDNPTPSQQQSIAKQVHSVVILYNYYHRKQHPELAYLPFNEFCKLTVVLRPALLAYMQFMQKLNEAELIDVEKHLSLTEKMIMDACDVCKCLDASKNVPNIEGWPISKVAILLIDSEKEYCFLLFGSVTKGVWSVVEKSVDTSSQSSEVTSETKYTYKKKRVIRKPTKDELKVDEAGFRQVGYSAVKEATGINNTDIMLLESYTVYSQSKEKEASRFYIMQCSRSINQEVFQVPLKDVIESLQGPLVKKSYSSWTPTPVVDYFHVLPYSEIISKWISREAFSNSLQDSRVIEKNIIVDSPEVTESKDTFTGLDSKPSSDDIESLKQKETLRLSDSIKEPHEMDVNEFSIFPSQNKEKCQNISNTIQVGEDQEKNNTSVQHNSNGSKSAVKHLCTGLALSSMDACDDLNEAPRCLQPPSARDLSISSHQDVKVDSTRMLITEGGVKNLASCIEICASNTSSEKDTLDDHTLIANHSNSDLEKLQILLDSKKIPSRTALTALIRKRNELALQQRRLEDEITTTDKKIQRLTVDGEEDFELIMESIIEGCNNNTWLWNQERMCGQQSFPPKRKKLSEAVFVTPSPCQELDGVCHENNWLLPIYHVSLSDGGFQANVIVKGVEFQCSCRGEVCSHPPEARDSAAAQMLTNLRSMKKLAK